MFKLVLEKAKEPEIKLPTSTVSSKKQESSRKTSISVYNKHPKISEKIKKTTQLVITSKPIQCLEIYLIKKVIKGTNCNHA